MNKNITAKRATMDTTTHNHKEHTTAIAPFYSSFFESLHKEQWKEVRLGEVAEINPLESIKKNTIAKKVSMDNLEPFNKKIYSFNVESFKGGSKFKNGDTLLARITPCLENGKTAFVDFLENNEIAFGSTEFIVLRQKENISNKHFLYYLARSENFRETAIKSMTGSSGRERVQIEVIRDYEFPLPPLKVQQQIAEILSSFDDKIDLLHRQNKTLESLALTLFRHTFIDNPNRNEWEMGKLGDYGKIICGKTPTKAQKEYFNGEIPFIKIPDMHNKAFVFKTADTLTQKGFLSQYTKTLPPLSICVSCIATVGVVSMNALESQTNQQINSIVPYKEYFRYFLYCFMKESFDELQAMASGGTATANLNTTDFSNMAILKPSDKELQIFHSCVKIYFDKIYNNTKQIQNLQSMRDMLLAKILNENPQSRRKER